MSNARNPIGWFELYVNDMPRAKAFYEAMLAVKLEPLLAPSGAEDMDGLEMWTFPGEMTAPGCNGALCKMEGCQAGGGGTLIYFSCQDCAVESARAAAAGGSVFKEKFSIGEYGFIALLVDTEGNMIGLHSLN